jgi:superfamily II DNA or RNA helicase
VIEHYRRHLDGKPVIVSCVSIEHAKLMTETFQEAGYTARTVWGDMDTGEREEALQGLGDGRVQVVTFCDLIGEGVDIPVVAGVIMLRRTLSLGLYLQIAGRALRPYPGKERAIILDHAGNYHLHGHVLADRDWSLDGIPRAKKGEAPPTTTACPKCYGVWPGKPRTCPGILRNGQPCGHVFEDAPARPVKPIQVIAGELVEAGLPEEEAEDAAEFVARAMRADPKTRQKMMIGRAFALASAGGGREEISALAKAIGYKESWTAWAWKYANETQRRNAS